jgi:excisionase family DNA binding protein
MSTRELAQPATVPALLNIDEIAEILNVCRRTLERMISTKEFPACDKRIRRMPRWRRESVDRWISGD